MAKSAREQADPAQDKKVRRDFLYLATAAVGAVGTAIAVWPLVDSMNPSADVRALSTAEFDLVPILQGQRITIMWQGKPVFIEHRTPEQTARAVSDDANADLIDPETDAARVQRKDWLVVIGVCTHLGCIPRGQAPGDPLGDWGGWFCPCHGSHYDVSGRIRKGPAPKNLVVPPYAFVEAELIRIG